MTTPRRKSCFELRAALDHFYLQSAELAAMCGVKPVQVWRWCEGKAEVPDYVWCLLSAMAGTSIDDLRRRRWHSWKIEPHHAFRGRKTFRVLLKRFHPDVSGRDTTAEMQALNALRDMRDQVKK
jgi:hypothetical protein